MSSQINAPRLPFLQRLSFRQTKLVILITFGLGLLFSLLQITLDYFNAEREFDKTVLQILNIVKQPATQAVYALDDELAREVAKGLLNYHPIYKVILVDEYENPLIKLEKTIEESPTRWLSVRLFGENRDYHIPLFLEGDKNKRLGTLKASVDIHLLAQSFSGRTLTIILIGLIRNFLLAGILLILFHYVVTKPLVSIARTLVIIDPVKPGKIQLTCPSDHQQDELGQLVTMTNHLLSSIRENEERLNQFLESIPVGVIVFTVNAELYYINQAAQIIFGEDLSKGLKIKDILEKFKLCVTGTQQPYPLENLPVFLALQGQPAKIDDVEIHQQDIITPLEFWGIPIYGEQGQLTYVVSIFQDITERLQREKAEIAKEAAEAVNKKIMESIQYAKIIQSALLPNYDIAKAYLPDYFVLWLPKDIVGGDMLYINAFKEGLIIAVIDCTGHGVPGAFMTMIATTSLKRIVEDEGCHEPSEILKRLNFMVKTALHQDMKHSESDDGLDAGVCVIKFEENVLLFAGAKLPLTYIHDQQAHLIKGNRQSIGYRRSDINFEFTTHIVSLQAEMTCYLFTDGLIDQLGGTRRLPFGHKRFTGVLTDIYQQNGEEQSKILLQALQEYQGNHDRQDDVTVIGFKLSPGLKPE